MVEVVLYFSLRVVQVVSLTSVHFAVAVGENPWIMNLKWLLRRREDLFSEVSWMEK